MILVDIKEDFTIGQLIGEGNFAKVHVGIKKSDEKTYAIKSLSKADITSSTRRQSSVINEIDILRELNHKNIIKLYEVYESDRYIHLILEYLDGGELFNRLKHKGQYQEKDAIFVMKNLLEALNFQHNNGIIHRDLKPENLILASKNDDHSIKIADFGLASYIQKGEVLYLRCGSPGYIAPELLQDKGYSCKGDIYSAGVILYVMLTGRHPFPGASINEILLKNKNADVQYPSQLWTNISEEAKDLVKKLLQQNPRNRISAEEALTHTWFKSSESQIGSNMLINV